jgi:hypothetical protein
MTPPPPPPPPPARIIAARVGGDTPRSLVAAAAACIIACGGGDRLTVPSSARQRGGTDARWWLASSASPFFFGQHTVVSRCVCRRRVEMGHTQFRCVCQGREGPWVRDWVHGCCVAWSVGRSAAQGNSMIRAVALFTHSTDRPVGTVTPFTLK